MYSPESEFLGDARRRSKERKRNVCELLVRFLAASYRGDLFFDVRDKHPRNSENPSVFSRRERVQGLNLETVQFTREQVRGSSSIHTSYVRRERRFDEPTRNVRSDSTNFQLPHSRMQLKDQSYRS